MKKQIKNQVLIPYRVHMRNMRTLKLSIEKLEKQTIFIRKEVEKLHKTVDDLCEKDLLQDIDFCLCHTIDESQIKRVEDFYALCKRCGAIFSQKLEKGMNELAVKAVCIA